MPEPLTKIHRVRGVGSVVCPHCHGTVGIPQPTIKYVKEPQNPPPAPHPPAPEKVLAGPDGPRVNDLLRPVLAEQSAVFAELARPAAMRALADPSADGPLLNDPETRRLSSAIAAALAAGDLLGRSAVRERWRRERAGVAAFADAPVRFAAFAESPLSVPGNIVPASLYALFKRREPDLSTPEDWLEELERAALTLAVQSGAVLDEKVKAALAAGTFPATPAGVDRLLDAAGVGPANAAYADLVLRTNAHEAYTGGYEAERQSPDVAELLPAWQYFSARLPSSRPHHAARHGNVYPAAVRFADVRGHGVAETAHCLCSPSALTRTAWEAVRAKGGRFAAFADVRAFAGYDPGKHPHKPAGGPDGGQFAPAGGGGGGRTLFDTPSGSRSGPPGETMRDYIKRVDGATEDRPADPAYETEHWKRTEKLADDILGADGDRLYVPRLRAVLIPENASGRGRTADTYAQLRPGEGGSVVVTDNSSGRTARAVIRPDTPGDEAAYKMRRVFGFRVSKEERAKFEGKGGPPAVAAHADAPPAARPADPPPNPVAALPAVYPHGTVFEEESTVIREEGSGAVRGAVKRTRVVWPDPPVAAFAGVDAHGHAHRPAGSPEGGEFAPTGGGGAAVLGPEADKAKFVGQKVGKAEHVHAAGVEQEVARAVKGKWLEDNEPLDVRAVGPGGAEHAIEVKSLLKGGKKSISVHDDALVRKVDYAAAHPGSTYHTVAVDERATYEGGAHAADYSGHRIYYRRGSGAYSLSQMHAVTDAAELRRLVAAPDAALPAKARGALPAGPAVAKLRASAEKAHASRLAKDRARKARLKAATAAGG
jgi:hypothetical protein